MTRGRPNYLIVGADSLVGGALMARLQRSGAEAAGTTRRPGNPGLIHLDLSEDLRGWRPPQPFQTAILCAGVTKLQACQDHPAASRRVNVQGITQAAEALHRAGAFVIYLSSNQVFDGSVPHRRTTDATGPITEYGAQKAEAERQLLAAGTADAIVRLTKVLGPQIPLFSAWTESLRQGGDIQAYSDMTMAPVPLATVLDVLLAVAGRQLRGIHHVSGEQDLTYEAAARLGALALGVPPERVRPAKAPTAMSVPVHTTLDVSSLKSATGVDIPAVAWTVETAFTNPRLLGG
jgi:dTDP-4-dehydrorhamnose reductase